MQDDKLLQALPVAKVVAQAISISKKTRTEIAKEVGYDRPEIINMFESGLTRIPIERIGRFAIALDLEPRFLIRLAMAEYMPEVFKTLEQIFGAGLFLTKNEEQLIRMLRKITDNTDPSLMLDVTSPNVVSGLMVQLVQTPSTETKNT
ncbi:helix-turn-helix domain-containing protein [Methylocaldum sp. RMAD-M]|jgi:hypothetical protein|uniref:helix-turn-helix domain-containing protein n=1 Tax=Methylocaldum sp. RMAD-M TaxID=2806557 RepID=UPI001AE756E8|nr:helix-turn-helix domain-containing protein [Methylocaldum sp. RMAD-M]MBP1152776.1 transcriptional regulator with XRE-family HTH domain [Methylocaldum sp. RMAD-M]